MAHMWRRVALSSKETAEQLLSYQNAIEALNVSKKVIACNTLQPENSLVDMYMLLSHTWFAHAKQASYLFYWMSKVILYVPLL